MECIFLDSAGNTLFTRSDMESGHWTVQEYSVNADFPFILDKRVETGQRIAFRDPATDVLQVFEIRNVQNVEADRYQQITAEHIAVSELSDEHIDRIELNNVTAQSALTTALNGTLWAVGTVTGDAGTQTFDINRGSVWDAVNNIQSTYNLYITPRIVISSAGAITNRYLDIAPAVGAWNGVRLSVRKNFLDPVVIYDDSNVLTALYAYGGSVDVTHSGSDDTQEELTIAGVAWAAEGGHPAKPLGQKYLEYPEKTAIYGRNGRPRFGYFQNSNITDANILLQKTWESLQATCNPEINISGTCADLYRLGYHDEPLRLHDTVIVEIEETGETFWKQIITLDVDLIDPTANRPEIGDFIPNIVYYSRNTNHFATTGSSNVAKGGGGGGRGQPNEEKKQADTYTAFDRNDTMIGMVIGTRNGNQYIKGGQIALAINKTGEAGSYETYAYVNGNHVNISSTTTAHMLTGSIVYDDQGRLVLKDSSGGGVYTERTSGGTTTTLGIWDKGNLTGGVMVQEINGQQGTKLTLHADVIDITGVVSEMAAYDVGVSSFTCTGQSTFNDTVYVDEDIQAAYGMFGSLQVMDGNDDYHNINIYDAEVNGNTLTIYKLDGTPINFSKATTLSGAWSGGTFSVSSTLPSNALSTTIGSVLAYDAVTYNNGLLTVPIKVTAAIGSGSAADTGYIQDLLVTAAPAMRAVDVSGSWSGGTFTAVSSANSAKNVTTTINSVLAYDTVTFDESTKLLNVPIKVTAAIGSGSAADTGFTNSSFKVAGISAYNAGIDACWDTVGIAEIYNSATLPSGATVSGEFQPGRYYRISPQAIKSDGQFHVNGQGWYYAPDTSSAAWEQGVIDGQNLMKNSIHHINPIGVPGVDARGLQYWTVNICDASGTVLKTLQYSIAGDASTGLIAQGQSVTLTAPADQDVNGFVNSVHAVDPHPNDYTMYKAYNTSDTIYYGRLYDSRGNALTNSSYYWFGCSSNLGGSSAASIKVWR